MPPLNLSYYTSAKDNKGVFKTLPQILTYFSDAMMKDTLTVYRQLSPGKTKEEFKVSKFPAVTWSGTFTKRSIKGLSTHSGLICMDVDKLTQQQHDTFKKALAADPHVFLLFTSVSGAGLKIIFKITPDANQHLQYFQAISAYLKKLYGIDIDISGKDVSRLCFLTYDSSFVYNGDAILFPLPDNSPVQQPETRNQKPGTVVEVLEDAYTTDEQKEITSYETLDQILKFTEKKATYTEGSRNTFINLFGWNCSLKGIPENDCIEYAKAFATDLPDHEVINPIKSVYATTQTDFGKYAKRSKKLQDKPQAKSKTQNAGGKPTVPVGSVQRSATASPNGANATGKGGTYNPLPAHGNGDTNEAEETIFWTEREVTRGKGDNKFTTTEYGLKRVEFVDWLFEQGFHLIDTDKQGGYQLCYSSNGIIDPVDPRKVKKHVFNWCRNTVVRDIEEMMREKQRSIFNMEELNSLHTKAIEFKRDTEEETFFFYRNCWITVTSEGITTHKYTELRQFIWMGNKIDRDFTYDEPITINKDGELHPGELVCEFARFVYFAAYNPNNGEEKDFTQELIIQRFESFCTSIGFMLDGYKHPSDRKAVFALDHKVGEKGEKHGRTGKSILPKACAQLKVVSTINGKTFDPRYQFRYEVITADAQIINFNDMKSSFDPEEIFEIIADDYSILRRNNGYIHFKYENSPKVYFSTNASPKGDGSSYEGRMSIIEFSDYFTPKHTPFNEFGHGMFGSAWSAAEWQRFDNFMLFCVQMYKNNGITSYPCSNLNERRLKSEVDVEFIDYMETWPRDIRSDKMPHLEAVRKLLNSANGSSKPLSAKAFRAWVKRYCNANGLYLNPHVPEGRYDKSGGIEYYTLATTPDFKHDDQGKLFDDLTASKK